MILDAMTYSIMFVVAAMSFVVVRLAMSKESIKKDGNK